MRPRLCVLAFVALLAGCGKAQPPRHDVYVWQQYATKWHVESVKAAVPQPFGRVRQLVGEVSDGSVLYVRPHPLPPETRVVAVVRLRGPPTADTLDAVVALIHRAQRVMAVQQAHIESVEWVSDVEVGSLPLLASLIRETRGRVDGLPMAVVALPPWREARALPLLLAEASEWVLAHELPDSAELVKRTADDHLALLDAWLPHMPPALPVRLLVHTEGLRGLLTTDSVLVHLELDAESWQGRVPTAPSLFHPEEALVLLAGVYQRGERIGLSWFRLPQQGGSAGWSATMFADLLAGEPWQSVVELRLPPAADRSGLRREAILFNLGPHDHPWPRFVLLPRGCRVEWAELGWRRESRVFHRDHAHSPLLRANAGLRLGTAVCSDAGSADVCAKGCDILGGSLEGRLHPARSGDFSSERVRRTADLALI